MIIRSSAYQQLMTIQIRRGNLITSESGHLWDLPLRLVFFFLLLNVSRRIDGSVVFEMKTAATTKTTWNLGVNTSFNLIERQRQHLFFILKFMLH